MMFNGGFRESKEIKNIENDKSLFNPDKRIEVKTAAETESSSSHETYNPDKRIEKIEPHKDGFYTTFEDRIKCTNLDNSEGGLRGNWIGERGNSKFIPSYEFMKEKIEKYGADGVEYKNGIVDFSPFVKESVQIDNMTSSRYDNFNKADEGFAKQFNSEQKNGRTDWTARDVNNYIQENGLTRHECSDMKTIELVPRMIHDYFKHSGGVLECKVRDSIKGGFDE